MSSNFDHGGNIFSLACRIGVPYEEIVDFSASINPLGLSTLVKDSLIAALDSLVHYPDNSHFRLKQALSNYHGLPVENFSIANGSTDIIYQLPALIKGKKALIVSPSFSEYTRSLGQSDWTVRHFILSAKDDFALDTAALEHALKEGFDLLYLCNPGNPSGTLYPRQIIEKVYRLCESCGTFLVLDEAFMDFCEPASAKQMIIDSDHGIILRSMTKFFAIPGLRLGYAIASKNMVERIEAGSRPWSVNTLAQVAGEAALNDSRHSLQTLELIELERNYLLEQLAGCPEFQAYPSAANYLLVEIKNGITAAELKVRLLQQRILIRDCSSFTGLSANFFRIAVRTRPENARLLECLKKYI